MDLRISKLSSNSCDHPTEGAASNQGSLQRKRCLNYLPSISVYPFLLANQHRKSNILSLRWKLLVAVANPHFPPSLRVRKPSSRSTSVIPMEQVPGIHPREYLPLANHQSKLSITPPDPFLEFGIQSKSFTIHETGTYNVFPQSTSLTFPYFRCNTRVHNWFGSDNSRHTDLAKEMWLRVFISFKPKPPLTLGWQTLDQGAVCKLPCTSESAHIAYWLFLKVHHINRKKSRLHGVIGWGRCLDEQRPRCHSLNLPIPSTKFPSNFIHVVVISILPYPAI